MGAGSIGSVIGGFLEIAGHDVYMIGQGAHIEAVMRDGLAITGIWGDHEVPGIKASDNVAEMISSGFEPEWTLLAVKSYDTLQAMTDLLPALEGQNGVVSMQNGLGNIEQMEAVAPGTAVGGRVIFGAATRSPGVVEVTVCADDVLVGPVPGGPRDVMPVAEAIADSKVPCRFEARILSWIWDKVLYNVCLNALATVLRTDYGHLADSGDVRGLMERLCREFYLVAAAEGVSPVSPGPDEYMKRFYDGLLPPTRNHRSSMRDDVDAGRRTEIEALNGAVWRMAQAHGIEAPANEMLTRMIRFLSARETARRAPAGGP